jgi:hypothetical protein
MTMPLPAPPPGEPEGLIVLDGYLDDETLPDDLSDALVRFQLVPRRPSALAAEESHASGMALRELAYASYLNPGTRLRRPARAEGPRPTRHSDGQRPRRGRHRSQLP